MPGGGWSGEPAAMPGWKGGGAASAATCRRVSSALPAHSATTATPDQVAAGMEHADTGGASLALVQLLWCLSAQLGPVRLLILHGLSSQNLALITSD